MLINHLTRHTLHCFEIWWDVIQGEEAPAFFFDFLSFYHTGSGGMTYWQWCKHYEKYYN